MRYFCRIVCLAVLVPLLATSAVANVRNDLKNFVQASASGDATQAANFARALLQGDALAELPLTADEQLDLKFQLAAALADAGALEEAVNTYEAALKDAAGQDGKLSLDHVAHLARTAELHAALGNFQAAAYPIAEALALVENAYGPRHPQTAWILTLQSEIIRKNAKQNVEKCGSPDIQFDKVFAKCRREANFAEAPYAPSQLDGIETRIRELHAAQPEKHVRKKRSVEAAAEGEPYQVLPVFYGVHRNKTGSADPASFYGSKRAPLTYGVVNVTVPKAREVGEVPEPSVFRLEFRPDPSKHVLLESITEFGSIGEFRSQLENRLGQSQRREIFVFVHGFNNDFDDAAKRTAQLAVDLEIDGAAVLYSWPSQGWPFGYVADSSQVIRPLILDLKEFLRVLADDSHASSVYLVAHSMGARFVLPALEEFGVPQPGAKPRFSEIVFAAPDVDAADFAARLPGIRGQGRQVTLYVAEDDRPLQLSRLLSGDYRRAGDASNPVVLPDLDTIDITAATGSSLGHSDLFDGAIDDFQAVIWHSLAPQARCPLEVRSTPEGSYWVLVASQHEQCSRTDFQLASALSRRLGFEAARSWLNDKVVSDTAHRAHWENVASIMQQIEQSIGAP